MGLDVRVMKCQRLKNLVVLVTAAAYFTATFLGQKMKLLIPSQRCFGIPPFRCYALADGIKNVPTRTSPDPWAQPPPSQQLQLVFGWEGQKI